MSVEWKEFRAELPLEVQNRLDEKRACRRLGIALAEVRKSSRATQQDIAERSAMTQNTVSKLENADDMLLSSVIRYMSALGGRVDIILTTGDGASKNITLVS